jgi:hypothetical protein
MKIQFNRGTGNKQVSDDDTTTQIQVGSGALLLICGFVVIVVALLAWRFL